MTDVKEKNLNFIQTTFTPGCVFGLKQKLSDNTNNVVKNKILLSIELISNNEGDIFLYNLNYQEIETGEIVENFLSTDQALYQIFIV